MDKQKIKAKDQEENVPQIFPISQELESKQEAGNTIAKNANVISSMAVNEEVKAERRRLSFQAMEENTESDVTPSPKVQKKKLEVTNLSSSSEDVKTESTDSNIEDEDFIRQQIMGMVDEEEMSISDHEKERKLKEEETITIVETENTTVPVKTHSRKDSINIDDNTTKIKALPKVTTETTMTSTTFKKAIPVMRQRQSTDEDVDSITDTFSKGSSSIQASSFTPESSPTSASSLEEDSDSSPSHRKTRGDKPHRKGKHRQQTQPLPTIEDSSEDERREEKSKKDRDQVWTHAEQHFKTETLSSTDDLRQVTGTEETSKTSGSEYSASIDSEQEISRDVQRGRKPSPTVIPYFPSDSLDERRILSKPLKSAEEAYEEIIQKTKAIPGESPPDIEPLYGGMSIEDYLYESLVEEPEFNINISKEEELQDTGSDSLKKLRTPEEVYEEMMQKKRELIMIEQEFQEAQTALESSTDIVSSLVAETCIVTMSTEDQSFSTETDMPQGGTEAPTEVPLKKKKRPAPPRPSEPPKRTEASFVQSTTRSIGFVRPMTPQDPALRKDLNIPDLKITQCSSGEEEDDSLAEEYGVGVSSDITPSDESETKEDQSISPSLSDGAEIEPICVVCEIPKPKPIPTPISAPELTSTPSPLSSVSPPTSPATPSSSLDSNVTSSPTFYAQTPQSAGSTPMSTPTPPLSFVSQPPLAVSAPSSPATVELVAGDQIQDATTPSFVVAIPDVVSDQAKTKSITTDVAKASPSPVDMSSPLPVVVQMPDLVSSPSQMPMESPSVIQVSAPTSKPVVVSTHSTAQVADMPAPALSLEASALSSSSGPVIVQMPDLVSTTSPICVTAPLPISAIVSTPVQTQAKVVHSTPVHQALPNVKVTAVSTPSQTFHPHMHYPASTTIIKKKVPPPPPPRSTSVTLPGPMTGLPVVKTSQNTTSTVATTASSGTTSTAKPMQSVVVDIQPRMEEMHMDERAVPQIVTLTRQGHVVIIVPSVENLTRKAPKTEDLVSSEPALPTSTIQQKTEILTHPSMDAASFTSRVTEIPQCTTQQLPPKPVVKAVKQPVVETPLPPLNTTTKPALYPKPQVSSTIASSTPAITTAASGQTAKPPPPIPPKPIIIPAGLVFSHKPGESVKPPPHVAAKAATLPRTKEPPNALSLSLTRPVESKLGSTSPKSPLSPRHSKCMQTYVVITLPSELGSPPDGITVQAPLRRGSVPSTKLSDLRSTPTEQKAETFLTQATVRRASVTAIRQMPPVSTAQIVKSEQEKTLEVVQTEVQCRPDFVLSTFETPASIVGDQQLLSGQDVPIEVHVVPTPIKKPYVQQPTKQITETPPPVITSPQISIPSEIQILSQPLTGNEKKAEDHVDLHSQIATDETHIKDISSKALIPLSYTIVAETLQFEEPIEVLVLHDQPNAAASSSICPKTESQTGVLHGEYGKSATEISEINVSTLVPQQPPLPENSKDTYTYVEIPIPVRVPLTEMLPQLAEKLPLQLAPVDDFSLPTIHADLTEVITGNSVFRINEKENVSPEVQPSSVAMGVNQTRDSAELIQPSSVDMVITLKDNLSQSHFAVEDQLIPVQPDLPNVTEIPQVFGTTEPFVRLYSTPPLEVIAMKPEHEMTHRVQSKDFDTRHFSAASPVTKHQAMTGLPVEMITTAETTSQRRTSLSSIVQPPFITNEMFTHPTDYATSAQMASTQAYTARRESITMQQPVHVGQVLNMPAERDVPVAGHAVQFHYMADSPQVITYSSEYDQPLEVITTDAYTRRTSLPTAQDIPQSVQVAPVTITKIQQESIESQEFRGPEKVVSSMSHTYSSSISASGQPPVTLPSLVTQVVTTEVQRTTVSVVHERLPQVPPPTVAITVQPDVAKGIPLTKSNGKILYPGDVIDLRTVKPAIRMTEQGMDLTPPESSRQSTSSDSSGRQITAVQPEIVNLSPEITPATTLSVVTDNITIVTCTATISSYNNTPTERPLDLQGPVATLPMSLTSYKSFEPLAQIIYRPVKSPVLVSDEAHMAQDMPMNLSYEMSKAAKQPLTSTPIAISNGGPIISLEATGAMDLSNYKPMRAMVALSDTSSGVVTSIVEDEGTPVDLTAGRRSVCCDVIYKLPFTGSCRTQPPVTTQPDNFFGYKEDSNGSAGLYGVKGMNGIKVSLSESGITEAEVFSYDPKTGQDYLSGSSDGAIDLTATKLSAGEYVQTFFFNSHASFSICT